MNKVLKIGTRDSELAVWQASLVKNELGKHNIQSELIFIKSEGDIDLSTPLYEIGTTGIFTKTLDTALINKRIDIAVHSMKDVPTQLAKGIVEAAVLPRASYKDVLVHKYDKSFLNDFSSCAVIATSSIRRKAQWLHRYPNHRFENLRGNINTRLAKVSTQNWYGAIFAAAGLDRIDLRPENSVELDWMLPAPAQGAILVVCREDEKETMECCLMLNEGKTALCTKLERDFLRTLMGGCSTPISALAEIKDETVNFKGNIFSPDGKRKVETEKTALVTQAENLGKEAAIDLINQEGKSLIEALRDGRK